MFSRSFPVVFGGPRMASPFVSEAKAVAERAVHSSATARRIGLQAIWGSQKWEVEGLSLINSLVTK
jgi:hypothetical protein